MYIVIVTILSITLSLIASNPTENNFIAQCYSENEPISATAFIGGNSFPIELNINTLSMLYNIQPEGTVDQSQDLSSYSKAVWIAVNFEDGNTLYTLVAVSGESGRDAVFIVSDSIKRARTEEDTFTTTPPDCGRWYVSPEVTRQLFENILRDSILSGNASH